MNTKKIFATNLILFYMFALATIPLLIFSIKEQLGLLYLYVVTILAIATILCTFRTIMHLSKLPYSKKWSFLGGVYIILSAIADKYITLKCNPDLSREGNPIILQMLEQGVSLENTIIISNFFDIGFVVMGFLFWILSLKLVPTIINKPRSQTNFLENFMETYGLSKSQFLRSLLIPNSKHHLASIGIAFLSISFVKNLCVLEWLEILPCNIVLTIIFGMLFVYTLYFIIMHKLMVNYARSSQQNFTAHKNKRLIA